MNFTHNQISELLLKIANSHNGSNILLQMTLEVFMKSERSLHKEEKPDDLVNGYPFRKAKGNDKELVLKVPRTRSSTFYPALLSILRGRVDHRTD
ncbi:transposase [Flavobacterium covae]|nr:transposase [Flavobacterium covae]